MTEAVEVSRFWGRLGLPGLVDVHTHFMPEQVLRKVWAYFDALGEATGGALGGRSPTGTPRPNGSRG